MDGTTNADNTRHQLQKPPLFQRLADVRHEMMLSAKS
jgi:hypothetical protein